MFVNHFVCCTQVCDYVGSGYAHGGAGRIGDPHVFANLNTEFCVFYAEKEVDAKRNGVSVNVYGIVFLASGDVKF